MLLKEKKMMNNKIMNIKVNLVDINPKMLQAWDIYFKNVDNVRIIGGDFFSVDADAVVSPANSFGFMDGGLDMHISMKLGWHVQERVKRKIHEEYYGELLVGQAIVVDTDNESFPYVISAPTMRVPMILGRETVNPYLAMKAALIAGLKHSEITTITVSGLGTSVGRVPFDVAAYQMSLAYREIVLSDYVEPKTWASAQAQHQIMYSKEILDLQKPNFKLR
jgi:O-acetyl-ADP-ribose deacetylase (regulator of RNase III)